MKQNKKKVSKKVRQKTAIKKRFPLGYFLFFLLLPGLLPFVYYRNGLDPAIHPRLLFVSIFMLIFVSGLAWIKRRNPLNTSILRTPVFLVMLAYFLIVAVSVVFAINPLEGNFDINKTFVTIVVTAVAAIFLTNTEDWQKKLPWFFIIPALTYISIGFYEYNKYVLLSEHRFNTQFLPMIYEVRGLMAHKNQFSIAMFMVLPFLGYGIYYQKGWLRWVSLLLSGLIFLLIILIKTRSVWVGITVAVTVAVFFITFYGSRISIQRNTRRLAGLVYIAIVLGLGTTIYFSKSYNPDSIVFKLKNIANPVDENNKYRLYIWQVSLDMIKDHPLSGVGAGNWKINAPYYFSGYGFEKDQLNWLRPHNDYLWVFAEKGIFGFIAFAGIFILMIIYLVRAFFSKLTDNKKVLTLLMLAGILGYLAISVFTFPLERTNHQVYLALMFAIAITLYHESFAKKMSPVNIRILSVPVFLILGYSIIYSQTVLKMETKVKQARILQEQGRWSQMLELSKTIPQSLKTLDAEAMPLAWYSGLAYANVQNIKEANREYQKAIKQHPTRIAVLNNLGRTYFQLGDYENAKEIFLQALYILPDYFESLVNVSSSYIQLKDYEKALEYLEKIPQKKRTDPIKSNLKFVRNKLREQGKLTETPTS